MATGAETDDERWSDWEEEEGAQMPTQGLFAPVRTFASPAECINAARMEHGFDLPGVCAGLGFYERVQLVNFVRTRTAEGDDAAALKQLVTSSLEALDTRPWKHERFLRPALDNDPLLFTIGADDSDADSDAERAGGAAGARSGAALEDEAIILSVLRAEPTRFDAPAGGSADDGAAAGAADSLVAQLAQMRLLLHDMSAEAVEPRDASGGDRETDAADEADDEEPTDGVRDGGAAPGGSAAKSASAPGRRRRGARTTADKVDEGYFGSYGELGIHHTMLSDRVRTEAYRNAICQPWLHGKVALDIGCGTAILSLFAASAGAAHVYGVDASGIIAHAQQVVRRNGMDDRITLVRGKAEEVALPVAKVDVIISEWMGYCLLYEAMLPSVLAARDKWLAPGGVMMPNKASMQLRLSSHSELSFWDDVYGYDMTDIGQATGEDKEADVIVVPAESALSGQATFRTIDIMTVRDEELDFNAPFELLVTADGTLRTFVASFETAFEPPDGAAGCSVVELKTGMLDPPTHWKQTLFHLKQPVDVHAGEVVRGLIAVARLGEGRRDLDVSITFSVMRADGHVAVEERSQLWQV
ncbi:hypothetical protein KFE25_010064 [Diacronema lutheri]|uniref:type I protein arginine methyltransferase n=2 Tax=Diacronema lutheri TaxID=2081491 RepID=A0A8J5XA49_DIALT|nr:hypothetical protein KFE25_010064 [Diacronema lutheri]